MDVSQSEDEFSDLERPSTSKAISPKHSISRYKSRKSPNSRSPSPSNRHIRLSKHKSSKKSNSSSPGNKYTSLFDKRKSSPRSKSPSPSHKNASYSRSKSFSRSRSPSPISRRKRLSKRKKSSNSKSSNRRKKLSKRKDKEIEYVDLVDDDEDGGGGSSDDEDDDDTINKSSQRNTDLSFIDVEEKVDALNGITAIASRHAGKGDDANICKSSERSMDLFLKNVREKVDALEVQRHVGSSFMDVEDRVNALDGIAAIASRYASKDNNTSISKSSQKDVDSSFMDVEDRVDALDGIAAIASRYASKGKDATINKSSKKHVDSSFMDVEDRVDALDGIAAIASRYASKEDNSTVSNSSERHVDSSFMNIEDRVDALDGIAAIASRYASKGDDASTSNSSKKHVDSSFMNVEDRVDALDGVAAIASRYLSKEDSSTVSNSSKRHVDLSFMDVEDKVDALDGLAAIASRYASKMNTDASISKGKGKSTKGEKNKDVSGSNQSSKSSLSNFDNSLKSKNSHKKHNDYNRNINESGHINRSGGNHKEFIHSGEPNTWNYSSIEGPSSWDDLRTDISPPRTRHRQNFTNPKPQNRKMSSEFIHEKKQNFPNEDLNSWDDLRPYVSHKRRGSSIPPPQKRLYFPDKNIRDDDLRFSLSPRNKFTKYKRPFPYEDINSWDDFSPKNKSYNRRCSSIPPQQKNLYLPNKRGSSICPPQKRAYSPSEEPQSWDDLRSYNPISSREKYTSKVSMGKHVSEEESVPREASSLPTLLSVPTCHICKKYFKTKFVFMKHLKFCDAFRTCFSCNKVLKTNANLLQHLTDTGHAKPTSSLETWKYISVKKFKSVFANKDVVEETEFCSESEIVKNLKEMSEEKSTKDCSRKSVERHSNEDDDENEDEYVNCEENDREIDDYLNVPGKSYVDESYFEEKEERNCLDGVAALFSRFRTNSSSDLINENQKPLEKVGIKDKEIELEAIKDNSLSTTKNKKEKKLIDNVDLANEEVKQASNIKKPKRLSAKDFFSQEGTVTSKQQEIETDDDDNIQTNNYDMTNINLSNNEECDNEGKENNDFETEKHFEEANLEFDICVEENNANKDNNECENVNKSYGVSIHSSHGNPKFSFVGFTPNESDCDINKENSETDSFKEFFDSENKDHLKVSDSECEIEPNSSNEASDDERNVNKIIKNNTLTNVKNVIEKVIEWAVHSSSFKQQRNTKKKFNIDKDGKKLNWRNSKNIKEDSNNFEEEEKSLLPYTNLKNKLADGNMKGTNILKCRRKGTATIIEMSEFTETCPGCSKQIDTTTLVFNLKTGKMSFWCGYCSFLLVKIVQSGPHSNAQEKGKSSEVKLKVKENKLHKKKDNCVTDQIMNSESKIKSLKFISKKNENMKFNVTKIHSKKDKNIVKKNKKVLKVNSYEKKNIKQVNTKNRTTLKSNKVVKKRGRLKKILQCS